MKIKIWGCRGSLPSPGRETLIYGGDSTCLEIISDTGEQIIIDAGSGIRKLGNSILKEKQKGQLTILFTHAHWDHISGFPFFKPGYSPNFSISLCGGPVPYKVIIQNIMHQMEAPYFPVDISEMKAHFIEGCRCDLGICSNSPGGVRSISCRSIPLNHPNGGYGFRFDSGGRSVVFLSDNELRHTHAGGLTVEEYADFCRESNLLIHDAQYTEKEYERTKSWGHSTFKDAADLAIKSGVNRLGLFHHDPDRTDEELAYQVNQCKKYLKEKGADIDCFACSDGMEIDV